MRRPSPLFSGIVKQGRLVLDQPQKFLVCLAGLEGRRVEVAVRRRHSQRSQNQNAAYWGILIEILSNHTGYDKDTMHEALKAKFASRIDPATGLSIIESTAAMDTVRFMKYYRDIQQWAAEFLHVYIPDPGEYGDFNEIITHHRGRPGGPQVPSSLPG